MSPGAVTLTVIGASAVAVAAVWWLMVRAARRRDAEHDRRVAEARGLVRAGRLTGAHEACEVPDGEELWFAFIARRYAGLGTRNREDAP